MALDQYTSQSGLDELEARIQEDLEILNYPAHPWVQPRQGPQNEKIYDVIIIGGGQSALALGFALKCEKIPNFLVLDENKRGREGPWRTFARMKTLRTPKHVLGPEYGIASLSVRSYYQAKYGKQRWQQLKLIPTEVWADYLEWFREVANIPIRNESKVGALQWQEKMQAFAVPVNDSEIFYARKVVLASGIDGSGNWEVPKFISETLPRHTYFHTHDNIDFKQFEGKRIGVLGAGASAFDNALMSLKHEAAEVKLFFRRKKLVNVNPYRWAEFVGFLRHHRDLPDDRTKWKFIHKINEIGQLPPVDTLSAVTKFSNFSMHEGCGWEKARYENKQIIVETLKGEFAFDAVILGTGFVTDLSKRPELKNFHDKIALWSDKFIPNKELYHEDLLRHPYLQKGFQFTEKTKDSAPYLNSLFNFTFSAILSNGVSGASISGMKYGVRKIVEELSSQFYVEDQDYYFNTLCNFSEREF